MQHGVKVNEALVKTVAGGACRGKRAVGAELGQALKRKSI